MSTNRSLTHRVWFWIAVAYTAVFATASAFTLFAMFTDGSGLGAVWLIVSALPSSLLTTWLPVTGPAAWAVVTAGGLLQAALLWWVALRRR
ncbi:hypothetical protein LX16_4966 [Stackebrandtia albiflava]|uniref:Uncharacterized protein n=1 Tax=Stackebrandtia albiflava TaxID=406432 RepID=A0A562UQA5_9ACTN|nr:hypothetical protein [Stackebrandtia albiflava]TWJ07802.1 hypothetical protein LX16_4966 [Stackebrandtia albiflava]